MAKTVNSDIWLLYKGSITFHLMKRISTLCSGRYMQVIKSLQHHLSGFSPCFLFYKRRSGIVTFMTVTEQGGE